MAGIRRSQGKWDEAVEYGEKAVAINPNDPNIMFSLESEKRLTAFKDPSIGERRLAALRKAGLPE
jgi:hypothetical protein